MKTMISIVSGIVLCFAVLVVNLPIVHAQSLPDLVVTKIECAQGKLQFTVTNNSNTPLPRLWIAVADVYFGRAKAGVVDLRSPTSGSIAPAGSAATYLTSYPIINLIAVKVMADPMNSIKELSETNNSMAQTVPPCSKTSMPGISPEPQPVPMPGAMPEPIPRPGAMPEPIPAPPIR